jgi:hypothetical protein
MVVLSISVIGENNDSIKQIELTVITQVNQKGSYITFPGDLGNIEPLWFEGNVIPNFYLRKSKNSRLLGVLTPQIIIRMFREESFPVRTPSYIPQITLYYLLKEKTHSQTVSVFGRLAHHSNGQDGAFFLDNGSINLESGDFTANFFEVGFIKTGINAHCNAYQFFKSSFEVHPNGSYSKGLDGIYSRYRWHNAFSIFKLSTENASRITQRPTLSIKGETTWMFGDYNSLPGFSFDRLNLSLTLYYHPHFLEDIGLFVQYYHGSDYYNIFFDQRIDVLRFGFMTEKLRF